MRKLETGLFTPPLKLVSPLPTLILLCIVAVVCYQADRIAYALGIPPQNFASFWSTTPLLAALLLLTPRRMWWAIIAVAFGAMALADLRNGTPIRFAIWFSLGNLVELLVAMLGISSLSKGLPDLSTVKRLVKYLALTVVLAPFVSGFIGAVGSQRGRYLLAWRLWFFSDALGFLIVTPAILSWVHDGRAWMRKSGSYLELAALMTLLGVVGYLIFMGPGRRESPALLYSLVPLLLGAALRLGLKGVSTSMIAITLLAISGAAHDRGPFSGVGALSNALSIQLFLFFAAIPFMFLAVLVEEQKRTDQTVRESEERFRSVFDCSAAGMALVAYDGRWIKVNRALCDLLGYSEQELLAATFQSLTHPDDLEADLSCAQKVFSGEIRFYQMEKRYIHKQGHVVWVTLTASAVPDASGSVSYGVAQVHDITARKNAEAASRRDQEELQRLAGRLITVQEEERKRIARDLHDDLSQRLALLCVDLDLLRQSLPGEAEEARELERMRHDTDELVHDMRRLSHDQHHPQMALGLQHGVASFCHDFSKQHGIAAKLIHEGDLKQIPETVCFTLFRVLQEAMSNVVKHSGADRVTVTLGVHGDQAQLRVTDHGRGFEIGSDRGLGLVSMRERLRLVGGTMRVNSSPLQGTDIEASIPIPISERAVSDGS